MDVLNEIAYNISFIYSFDDMRKTVLDRLNMLIGFHGAVFSLVDNHEVTNSISYNIDDKNIDLYEKNYSNGNPLYWLLISGYNMAYLQTELLTEEAMEQSNIYHNFYLPCRFKYAMGMNIVFREEVVGLVTFSEKKEGMTLQREISLSWISFINIWPTDFTMKIKKATRDISLLKDIMRRISREFGLTGRESELLDYAVRGYSNEKIAGLMNISVNTVKKHFHSLYEKMHVTNRVQLLQGLPLSTDKINFDEL